MKSSKILLIDDNGDTRGMLSLMLSVEGYRVTAVADSASAFNILQSEEFDLVLTDILMPDIDGLELIRRIRKDYPDLKIVAMSAGGRIGPEEYLKIATRLGAVAVLRKPFTQQEMLASIRSAL